MSCRLLRWEKGYYEENHSQAADAGVPAGGTHGAVRCDSSRRNHLRHHLGRNYHYYEDKSNVPQWGPFISTKLKYFTRSDTGKTVPAYCMEPAAASSGSALGYSSVSWSALSWNQRYAVTLALAYGHGGSYTFDMNPDYAQLATQAIIWEFVCGYRSPTRCTTPPAIGCSAMWTRA